MRTTATMMFGVGETFDQRINHFEVVRRLQEETGGFTAFIPWSFQPKNTALGGRGWDEATSVEYLKVLAIARLYLDNIENVQASWVTQGLKVLELGLHFGGNDVGSVMLEENVVRAAGTSNCTTEEELRRIIRDAGFKPVQRDTLYRNIVPELAFRLTFIIFGGSSHGKPEARGKLLCSRGPGDSEVLTNFPDQP